ncbi:uncharacterized protein [Dermacentor albipictus]|uniref:uncharacterized protein isoform X2 n=1 Tax=Dermacentor albipictus TaxID=60249 RepID=UPI0031FC8455
MPSFCAAFGCANTGGRDDVVFHRFPKDKKLAAQWVRAVRRDKFVPTKSTVLCSDHFRDSDYHRSLKTMRAIGIPIKSARLKLGVVPSIFSYKKNTSPPPKAAFAKRRKREILAELLENRAPDEPVPLPSPIEDFEAASVTEAYNEEAEAAIVAQAAGVEQSSPETADKSLQVLIQPVTSCTASQADINKKCNFISRGTQTKPRGVSIGVQVGNFTADVATQVMNVAEPCYESDSDSLSDSEPASDFDDDYNPDNDPCHEPDTCTDSSEDGVILVEKRHLTALFLVCRTCLAPCTYSLRCEGTLTEVCVQCPLGHQLFWRNQDVVNQQPVLNLKLSAALLFSGNNPAATLRMLASIGVEVVTGRTFFNIQRIHLWPAVDKVWREQQKQLFENARGQEVELAGDGRADSPGFSAKFGTYSLMDVANNKVLHVELVQSNEVGGSCHMELEGLKRSLQFLENHSISVKTLVTDRHAQIKAYMRREKPGIRHEFDVWHVAKGVSKKLTAISKRHDCKELQPWVKSIQNHLYWAVASSHSHSEQIVPKWLSLLNHIKDVHIHNSAIFPACLHEETERRQWLSENSKAYERLQAIAASKPLLLDMPKLSTSHQTYGLETFHGLVIHFAPKYCQYSYLGMKARTQLAALHHNENSERGQACRVDGEARWNVKYPKATGGKGIACPVKERTTHSRICGDAFGPRDGGGKEFVITVQENSAPDDPATIVQPVSSSFQG